MPVKMRARLCGVRRSRSVTAAAYRASPRRPRVRLRDEGALHVRLVDLLEHDAGPAGHAGERVVGDVDGHLGRLGDAPTDALQERATAGEDDASIHDVGDELGRVSSIVSSIVLTICAMDASFASRTCSAMIST